MSKFKEHDLDSKERILAREKARIEHNGEVYFRANEYKPDGPATRVVCETCESEFYISPVREEFECPDCQTINYI